MPVSRKPKWKMKKKKSSGWQVPKPGTLHLTIRHVPIAVNDKAKARAAQESRNIMGLVRFWLDLYGSGGNVPLPTYEAPESVDVEGPAADEPVEEVAT